VTADAPAPIERLATAQHVVALTLDAGGNADAAPRAFAELRRAGIPVTLFLTGRWVTLHPVLAHEIGSDAKWVVGDHTVDHQPMPTLPPAKARWEIVEAAREIEHETGRDPKPLFRFPYGAETPALDALVARLGYVDVRWSVDSLGWRGPCCQSVAGIVSRVVAALRPGAIVLMHIGSSGGGTLDTDALPAVIHAIEAHGYRFVTVPR
jgi:peptidoglycan/xylan/chitin deacetylase (PgdA/CDA1 family)